MWSSLKKPILALAPMAGFTDSAFRQICKKYGADLVYTEMVSAQGLSCNSKKTFDMLRFSKIERPVVLQLLGKDPEKFKKALKKIKELPKNKQPDGIDINFGCPARKVIKNQGGAALMKNLKLCHNIVQACCEVSPWPVSVKIRAGIKLRHNSKTQITALSFLRNLRNLPLQAVMIHARTYEQGFSGEPNWEIVKSARKFFKGLLLANGSINSADEAQRVLKLTNADGVGIGRAAIGAPWIFEKIKRDLRKGPTFSKEVGPFELKKTILEHAKLVYQTKEEHGIIELRKHLVKYVAGMHGAKKLREKLVKVKRVEDIQKILEL